MTGFTPGGCCPTLTPRTLSGSPSGNPWPSAKPSMTAAPPWARPPPKSHCGQGMTTDQIECIEEGGTEPTITLLRRLAALDADVRITAGDDLGSVGFEAHAA